MSVVTHLTPTNLLEEQSKFFKDANYNPQFTYSKTLPAEILRKWGEPDSRILDLSESILNERADLIITRHNFSNDVVLRSTQSLIEEIGIQEKIEISFIKNKITRCSVTKNNIVFRDPADFESTNELTATLNHEVQTHLLRNLNQRKQGWTLDREKYDHLLLRTEEGLAVLHACLAMPDGTLWRAAAYYLAVWLSTHYSFSKVFTTLVERGFDEQFAWRLVLRTKRGLTDTSKPGGNTKDLCYLEGAVKVWKWISSTNNPGEIYLGKIFIEELEDKKNQVTNPAVYLPTFMHNIAEYKKSIDSIGQKHNFERYL